MNKSELINAIADQADISKSQAKNALDATLEAVSKSLSENKEVKLTGFGTFSCRFTAAREGHNPANGEKIQIPAKVIPAFKAGATLKNAVNG